MSHRSIAIIRAELAAASAVVDTYDHDECHTGDSAYWSACSRATHLADELHLAEMDERFGCEVGA